MFQEPGVPCFFSSQEVKTRQSQAKQERKRLCAGMCRAVADHLSSCRVVVRSWQNMETAKRRGLCRHIGVSNYPVEFMKARSCHHIKVPLFGRSWTMLDSFWAQEIDEYKTEPIYNEQQELHPLAQFRDVQDYARKAKVSLTGYGTGRRRRELQYSF